MLVWEQYLYLKSMSLSGLALILWLGMLCSVLLEGYGRQCTIQVLGKQYRSKHPANICIA